MSKYQLATKETLIKLAEERDKYKKALEEIITHDPNLSPYHYVDIAREALNETK